MPWFRVDDSFDFHPKAIGAGNAALGLWVRAGAYSSRQLTEGFIEKHMIPLLGGKPRDAKALVDAKLWAEVEGGYQFHQWESCNFSKEKVLADRAAAAERQRKSREAKSQANGTVTNIKRHGVTGA